MSNFWSFGSKKMPSGRVKKYPGQSWVGLLFTTGQKHVWVRSEPIFIQSPGKIFNPWICYNYSFLWYLVINLSEKKIWLFETNFKSFVYNHEIFSSVWLGVYSCFSPCRQCIFLFFTSPHIQWQDYLFPYLICMGKLIFIKGRSRP